MNLEIINKALNFIFPPVCGLCGKISKTYLCESCKIKIKDMELNELKEYEKKDFKYHFYIFEYKDIIRDKIISYKFQDDSYLFRFFSEIILDNKILCEFINKYDYIIAVPIHKKRLKKRGYNQSALIAKEFSKKLNVTYIENILVKVKNIKPQSSLNKKQRCENIKGAYILKHSDNENILKDKKVLIFDDIYTTGNTVNECSKILNSTGCKEISIITIAKD